MKRQECLLTLSNKYRLEVLASQWEMKRKNRIGRKTQNSRFIDTMTVDKRESTN
jgi:hypothetical protein